jgi:hypothetical protein
VSKIELFANEISLMFAGFSLTLMTDEPAVFKVPPVLSSDLHTGRGFSTELADLVQNQGTLSGIVKGSS